MLTTTDINLTLVTQGLDALVLTGQRLAFLSTSTLCLEATIRMLQAVFTFVTLKRPLKRQPRSSVIADSESQVSSS